MATLTRADGLTYLAQWFGELYRTAGRLTDDSDAGFKPVLDEAWQFQGLAPATDVAPDREKATVLLSAFAYKLALNWLVTLFNGQTDAPTTRIETFQVYQGTVPLAQLAFREAKRYGFGGKSAVVSTLRVDDVRERTAGAARISVSGRRGRPWTEFG